MKKKPEKQKKKVVVDEREIDRIGDQPIEYVMPKEESFQPKTVTPQRSGSK